MGKNALQHIESFTAEELMYALNDNIKNEAVIKTDSYHSYKRLAKQMKNLTYSYSEKGSSIEELRKQIKKFMNWYGGTHHQSSNDIYLLILMNIFTGLIGTICDEDYLMMWW